MSARPPCKSTTEQTALYTWRPGAVEINIGRRDRARTYGCFAWATQPDNGLYDA